MVKENRISVGLRATFDLGKYESVQLSAEREMLFEEDLSKEQRGLHSKEMFLECLGVIVNEGHEFFEKFGKAPVHAFPSRKG